MGVAIALFCCASHEGHPKGPSYSTAQPLDNIIPPADRGPCIAVCRCHRPLLQQAHQLSHRICDHNLCIAFDKDVELGIFTCLRFFACTVETSFGCNGRACRFENLGDVRPVGDRPSCFF